MTSPPAAAARFHPTRAGIINLWDYRDEEFVFADGRLVLRGPNGSGKTKALEVLFPFVFDGRIEPRRLNPFAGEERTMRSNLLYRGQDSAYSYVWMEFRRPGGPDAESGAHSRIGTTRSGSFVTVGVGMRASRQNDRVSRWYFVADGRVGIDFSLLSGDDRPLTKRELVAELPDGSVTDRSALHRAAVDQRLFGLGPERFEQLLTLVLTLRRPQLAKNLDPKGLSQALTDGLRPLDSDLIAEAARSFADMETVQQTLANIVEADEAARGFLADYTTYVRAHARAAADRLTDRSVAVDRAGAALAETWQERRGALTDRTAADDEKRAAETELGTLNGRLESLRASPGYRDRQQLAAQAALVGELAAAATQAQARSAAAAAELARRSDQHGAAEEAQARAAAELARFSAAALAAAADAGISFTATDVDHPDLRVRARSSADARAADIAAVRAALAASDDARRVRGAAQDRLTTAEQHFAEATQRLEAAESALEAAHAELLAALQAWTDRHRSLLTAVEAAGETEGAGADRPGIDRPGAGEPAAHEPTAHEPAAHGADQPLAERLSAALAALVPELGGASDETLPGRFDALVTPHADRIRDARARESEQAARLDRDLADLRARRDSIAAENDDAPPAFAARTADRHERPGAPLWRLVAFAETVDDAEAAGLEAALHAANLLDAWVLPDDDTPAPDSDTMLVALPPENRPAGPTLADVLAPDIPADCAAITPERVAAILSSVALGADGDPAGTWPPSTAPTVAASGGFRAGLQVGSHHAPAAQYIGAAARARRRARRLAALDDEITTAAADLDRTRARIAHHLDLANGLTEARRQLPATREMGRLRQQLDHMAGRLAATRSATVEARSALDRATAALSSAETTARRIAAERSMPTAAGEIDAVAAAVDAFRRSTADTLSGRDTLTDRQKQLQSAEAEVASARTNAEDRRAEADRAASDQARRQAELDTLREALGATAEKIDADIADTERRIGLSRQRGEVAGTAAEQAAERFGAATAACTAAGERLHTAIVECQRDSIGLRPFAAAELREILGVETDPAWPGSESAWPDPARAVAEANRAMDGATSYSPAAVPEAVRALHQAIITATANLRPTESSLKSSSTRVSTALDHLQTRLTAAGHDYRPEWDSSDGIIVVSVADEDGFTPIGRFAERVAAARKDQEQLLTESERRILEDALLGRLAQQIHTRTLQARDLIGRMSDEMKRRRMSSGAAIGIRWVLADDVSADQRQASALLDRDAARLGADDLAHLRAHFADRIKDLRAARPDRPFTDILGEALDYRQWRTFQLTLTAPDGTDERLTKARHSTLSGGEQSVSLHLPLFAAAHVMLGSARADAPRLVAMDEAFAGIDDAGRGELLGLTVDFDLDLFMTGHDLWATYASVPGCAHYDLRSSAVDHTVSSLLLVWDGGTLLADGGPGSADSARATESDGAARYVDLAAELGSPGTRRAAPSGEPMLTGGEYDEDDVAGLASEAPDASPAP